MSEADRGHIVEDLTEDDGVDMDAFAKFESEHKLGAHSATTTKQENHLHDGDEDATADFDMDLWKRLEIDLKAHTATAVEQMNSNLGESNVSPPLCTDEFTFLPGCCSNVAGCNQCVPTQITMSRQTNADLAAKAMHIDFSTHKVSHYC
jgi:hypothetical protein